MFDKVRQIPVLNQFFCTPKVPLSFYYTSFIPVIIFLNFISITEFKWFSFIVMNAFYLLLNYCYAWFCDYMLYRYKNPFIQFVFMKSIIFNKGMQTGIISVYNSLPSELKREEDSKGRIYYRESRETAFKQSAKIYFVILPLIKFFITLVCLPLIFLLPFIHIFLMKTYYKLVAADIKDETNLVNEF
ncbi:hypothetical protein [Macrococcus equi]|uniref:hypothetical protein n=1 Tax=Macrococcus equi TaxID=3395462 RepID=UPI0039BE0FD5